MINKLYFAFFEFLPLINPGIVIQAPNDPEAILSRDSFTPEMYVEFIEEKVETLSKTGAKYIILSTVEENGFTFYISDAVLANEFDNEFVNHENPQKATSYRPRKFVKRGLAPDYSSGFYLDGVKILLEKTKAINERDNKDIKVLLGTGRNGDKKLMSDLYQKCGKTPESPDSTECQDPKFKKRFSRNNTLTKNRIDDLHTKYGSHTAMGGFYLTHETSRFRATLGRYYGPAAKHAKSKNSNYMVVTSPSYIYRDERTTHKNLLGSIKTNGIDALMYQDRMGAAVKQNGNGVTFTYKHRDAIENHLPDYLATINGLHMLASGTPPELWINMESWRYKCHHPEWKPGDPKCLDGDMNDLPDHFPSYPAYDSNFQRQIDIASQITNRVGTYEISAIFQINGAKYKFARTQREIYFYNVKAIRLLQCFTSADGRCPNDPY